MTEEGSRLAALFLLDLISGAGLVSFSKAHQNLLLVPKSTCYLGDFYEGKLRKYLLSGCCLFAFRPTLPHCFRNTLTTLGRQFPLFARSGFDCLSGFCGFFRCRPTGPAAPRLVAGEQIARMLQASYFLVDAGQYFFYFHVPSLGHRIKNAKRSPL